MNREEFLIRCATAFDAGLIRQETMCILDRWTDMVMRLEGGQTNYFTEALAVEQERLDSFHPSKVLANDTDGYDVIRFAAILNHHCQACATDPQAWWTRGAMCDHKAHGCKDRM